MSIGSRLSLAGVALVVLASVTCSDDSNPTGGGTPGTPDTTPPNVTSVTPVDEFHLSVTFDEPVDVSAEYYFHYVITELASPLMTAGGHAAAVGDTVLIAGVTLAGDKQTASVTTASSMAGLNCNMEVAGVKDTQGNYNFVPVNLPFAGSNVPDQTAPSLASRSPESGVTGVTMDTHVVIQFSEPVQHPYFSWTSSNGAVSFSRSYGYIYPGFGTTYGLYPQKLEKNTKYTITASFGADVAGNVMSDTQWSFTTLNLSDSTPPRLVSSTPANLARNVDINTEISLTFSEAIVGLPETVQFHPYLGAATYGLSDDGRTLTYHPIGGLRENQQYAVTMSPGSAQDVAGNVNATMQTVVFTTGSMIATGSIAGTLSGDPGSAAADPTGAIVVASMDPSLHTFTGVATVAGNNTYLLSHLPAGTYGSMAFLETNHDGILSPYLGDAIGTFGATSLSEFASDSVVISNGQHAAGINFQIFDPVSLDGAVSYHGAHQYDAYERPIYIGLFDAAGWSPASSPRTSVFGQWPDFIDWRFNQFYQRFPDGDYYVGAFLDLDDDGVFNPAIDPAGMYGGSASPTVLHVANGHEIRGVVIELADPASTTSALRVTWPAPQHNEAFKRICDAVDRFEESRKTAPMR